jgi:hypothetical protein
MKTTITLAAVFLCLILSKTATSQIFADKVISAGPCAPVTLLCPNGVINPGNAVDADRKNNYAIMRTDIGILNFSQLTVGFPQYGFPGMTATVVLQTDGGLLTADVLQSITISLFNSQGQLVAERGGSDFANVEVGTAGELFRLRVNTKSNIDNIASVKIKIAGLLSLLNSIRVYSVFMDFKCPDILADIVHGSQNVQNPDNAVSSSPDDFALLTPPILLGSAFLDVEFSNHGEAGKLVSFTIGEGNVLLSLTVLQNITLAVFDAGGNTVATKTGFTLADLQVLPDNRFRINIKTPTGNYEIARVRITLKSLVSIAASLKVFRSTCQSDNAPAKPKIAANGAKTICNGSSVQVLINTVYPANTTYQWYKNNQPINGATSSSFNANDSGSYFVLVINAVSCANISSPIIIKVKNCLAQNTMQSPFKITMYPNPFNQYIFFNINSFERSTYQITVSNKMGNVIEERKVNGASTIRLLERAAPGIYFIKITSNSYTETRTVIKQ